MNCAITNRIQNSFIVSVLQERLSAHRHDDLFTVSMDHSPSEQLENDDTWYTTVLILSCGVEHSKLARQIATEIRPKNRNLRKWSARTPELYRAKFAEHFCKLFPYFPVYVFAISAKGSVIRESEDHFVKQLHLKTGYQKHISKRGRRRIQIGPLMSGPEKKKILVSLAERRGQMVLFISHFVIRMYDIMTEAIYGTQKTPDNAGLRWGFLADKFPGPPDADMDLMFRAILGLHRPQKNIIWGYFKDGDRVETDLLADNLAGLLSGCANDPTTSDKIRSIEPGEKGGLFYWEKWD
ncbi:MAG: hypothetical protein WD767_10370 [Alphaproteobacteria bacterium]